MLNPPSVKSENIEGKAKEIVYYKMSIGKVKEFDVQTGNWSAYVERLEMYFLANGVKEELKLPTLISACGESAYDLLSTLASPRKPSTLTYSEAVELVRQHLQPKPSEMAERYKFRQRRQAAGESISDYITALKKLSKDCQFTTMLEINLRDQFVCGLASDVIRQRLFAEENLTYEKAVNLAYSLEAAERDAALVEPGRAMTSQSAAGQLGEGGGGLHAVRVNSRAGAGYRVRGGGDSGANTQVTQVNDMCGSCGGRDHLANDCKFKNYVCSKCGMMGHLRRVCWNEQPAGSAANGSRRGQRGRGRGWRGRGRNAAVHYCDDSQDTWANQQASEEEPNEEPVMQMSLSHYKPVSMCLNVQNRDLLMEIDTGSALSCISKQTYDTMFSDIPLLNCDLSLVLYDGTKVRPIGYCEVKVTYHNLTKVLDLYVINNGCTTLLGRQWLAEMHIDLPKFQVNAVNKVEPDMSNTVNKLFSSYAELFDGRLGRFTGGRARLHVREGAVPVYCRARPLPYALRERVDAELDTMLAHGVIEPVDSSDWATPTVPVNKPDGSVRLCADYKVTLNQVLSVDKYPVPKIDDLLSKLEGSRYFSKIDLSQAYNQIELDETKKYTVINTHRGLFLYNRLVYGLSSSPGIFQRIMTNLFKDIPGVVVFLDDILVATDSVDKHIATLTKVLDRLKENGLKLKKEKCDFFVKKVKYLGYIIDPEGIHADPDKIKPILDMTPPKDVSELRSFIGMINFYSRFIKNLSMSLSSLYILLKKDTVWNWGRQQQEAFKEVKRRLSEACALCHYSAEAPLVVTCDASARGLGAVLAQRAGEGAGAGGERPVMFASRALTPAELNYSQIQKEALAIVFAVKKFHQYLYGRSFILRTDHKPLVTIFGPNQGIPSMTASRLQRWALLLTAYDFKIEYVSSSENVADALSRMIRSYRDSRSNDNQEFPEQTYLHFASEAMLLDYENLKQETMKDPMLSRILSYTRDGWPQDVEIKDLKPYFNRKNELYEELGCVMWGHRVVIPRTCTDKVLRELHDAHMGINKTKLLARSYVWWPGLDEAVEAMCRACTVCAAVADAPQHHVPQPWPWPQRPWTRLHADFLGPIGGTTYLVVVDAFSKWIEISKVNSTSAKCLIDKLRDMWARFGIPKQMVSDNGPPFSSAEFAAFLKDNGVDHVFSAPYHPSSNGAAENAVRTCKRVIKKAIVQGLDINTALYRYFLVYRNTPHCTTGESPAQMLQGRSLRTRLDALRPARAEAAAERVVRHQARQQRAAGGMRRAFAPGALVWVRNYRAGNKWIKGKIYKLLGKTDYSVLTLDNKVIHRHVDQIKPRSKGCIDTDHENGRDRSYLVYPNDPHPTAVEQSGQKVAQTQTAASTSPVAVSPRRPNPEETPRLSPAQPEPEPVQRYPARVRRKPTRFGFEID